MELLVKELVANKFTDESLYTLADTKTVRVWNYELPTLTLKGRFTNRQQWDSSAEFRDALFKKFPIFEFLDLSNIAIMGGAVFDILHCRESSIADIDLFFCGDLFDETKGELGTIETRIIQRAEKFIDDIYKYLEDEVKRQNEEAEKNQNKSFGGKSRRHEQVSLSQFINNFKASRNGPVITLTIPTVDVPVQLVLAPNTSITKLLRHADLDCTALAYYNSEVYFNSLSKFCFENGCTIVGHTKNKGSFESRLAKYFDKGMDIILPELSMSKIPKKNLRYHVPEVIDLPYLAVVFNEVSGQKIMATSLVPTEASFVTNNTVEGGSQTSPFAGGAAGGSGGGYDMFGEGKGCKASGVIIHENIAHLVHDLVHKLQFHGEGKYVKDVLLPIPKFTNRMITNTFETVHDQVKDAVVEGTINLVMLEKFFVVKPLSCILQELLVVPLQAKEMTTNHLHNSHFGNPEYTERVKAYLRALVDQQIVQTHEKLEALLKDYEVHPEKYPVVASCAFATEYFQPKEWYGDKCVDE